jgi:hypothetical protein
MRVKRNNIVAVRVFTGRDLIEKLYSEGWEVEQREYGLLSGVKKLSKGAINAISDLGDNLIVKPISRSKMGKKIIDKTQDSIEDSLDKRIKLDREIKELDKSIKDLSLSNEDSAKSIKNNLKNEAAKNKAYILEDKSNTSGKSFENGTIDIRNPEIKKAVRKKLKFDGRKDMEHFNNSNDLILFKESSGNPALAHEIGHVINRNSKGKAAKIDREAENIIEEFHKPADSLNKIKSLLLLKCSISFRPSNLSFFLTAFFISGFLISIVPFSKDFPEVLLLSSSIYALFLAASFFKLFLIDFAESSLDKDRSLMDLSNSLISLSNLILLSNESSIESCVLSIIFFPIFDLLIGFTIKLSPKSLIALIAPFDNFFTPESNPYSRCSTSQPSEYSFSIKSLPVKTLTATILFLFTLITLIFL